MGGLITHSIDSKSILNSFLSTENPEAFFHPNGQPWGWMCGKGRPNLK